MGERIVAPELNDFELSRSAVDLARRFVQRWDVHSRQLPDGRYIFVNEPLTVDHLLGHLKGDITLGTYLLDTQSKAKFVVLDADDEPSFSSLVELAMILRENEVPSYLEVSRRGGHMWLFFSQAVAGGQARAFGLGLLAAKNIEGIEVFPKQGVKGEGPGSLIRLPFGIHRLTGQRYGFITPEGEDLAPTMREQILALSFPQTVSEAALSFYQTFLPSEPDEIVSRQSSEPRDTLSERIKESISVLDFVGRYVELKPSGRGATGRCPFHDDQHPSFGVNEKGNYWNCFAGCGGGSVIDFWMKWRDCDFKTAIKELADMQL